MFCRFLCSIRAPYMQRSFSWACSDCLFLGVFQTNQTNWHVWCRSRSLWAFPNFQALWNNITPALSREREHASAFTEDGSCVGVCIAVVWVIRSHHVLGVERTFTPASRAVHLCSDYSGRMLMPCWIGVLFVQLPHWVAAHKTFGNINNMIKLHFLLYFEPLTPIETLKLSISFTILMLKLNEKAEYIIWQIIHPHLNGLTIYIQWNTTDSFFPCLCSLVTEIKNFTNNHKMDIDWKTNRWASYHSGAELSLSLWQLSLSEVEKVGKLN